MLAWATVSLLGDRVWWALPFLYGPRWCAGVFLLGLVPALLLDRVTALRAGLVTIGAYVIGLLGMSFGLGRLQPSQSVRLTIVEMNAGGSSQITLTSKGVRGEVTRLNPDVVIIAECSEAVAEALTGLGRWSVRRSMTSLCLGSRLPILDWEVRDPTDFWKEGGAGAIARATIATSAGVIRVGLVHLETPRDALENYFDLSSIPTLGEVTRHNMRQRDRESAVARDWIFRGEKEMTTIVGGDFNLPVESAIYRQYWGDLRNAFSRAGIGIGNTKQTRRWGMRIDHVLTTGDVVTDQSYLGRAIGSDHTPLVAELSLPTRQRTSAAR